MNTSHLELHTETLADGVVVVAHVHGTLDGADYDAFLPELNAIMAQHDAVSFLLFMDNFRGWDIEAMARELKWDAEHRGKMRKIAVVGESGWQKWATELSGIFLPGNVRYFSQAEAEKARAWVGAAG